MDMDKSDDRRLDDRQGIVNWKYIEINRKGMVNDWFKDQ